MDLLLCSMCLGSAKAKEVLGDSLSSGVSGFVHRRWECVLKERNQNGNVLFRNRLQL